MSNISSNPYVDGSLADSIIDSYADSYSGFLKRSNVAATVASADYYYSMIDTLKDIDKQMYKSMLQNYTT
jgi:hypothetical protein